MVAICEALYGTLHRDIQGPFWSLMGPYMEGIMVPWFWCLTCWTILLRSNLVLYEFCRDDSWCSFVCLSCFSSEVAEWHKCQAFWLGRDSLEWCLRDWRCIRMQICCQAQANQIAWIPPKGILVQWCNHLCTGRLLGFQPFSYSVQWKFWEYLPVSESWCGIGFRL